MCRKPKSHTSLSRKSFATEGALRAPSLIKQGINLQYLVYLSTQVKIALYPLKRGRSMIKTILQDTDFPFGTGSGYDKPG